MLARRTKKKGAHNPASRTKRSRRFAAIIAGCAVALTCCWAFVVEIDAVVRDGSQEVRPRCLYACTKRSPTHASCNSTETVVSSAAGANSTVVIVRVGQARQAFWFAAKRIGKPPLFGEEQLALSQGSRKLVECPAVRRIVLCWWHPAPPPVPFGVYGGNGSQVSIQVADHRSVGLGERVMASRLESGGTVLDGENVVLFDDDTTLDCSSLTVLVAAADRWPDKIAAPYTFCRRIDVDASGSKMVYAVAHPHTRPWMNVAITPAILMKTELLRRAERAMPPEQVEWSSKNLQGEDVMLSWAVANVSADTRAVVCVHKVSVTTLAHSSAGGLSLDVRKKFPQENEWQLYLEYRGNVSDHVARALPLGEGPCAPMPAVLARLLWKDGSAPALAQSSGEDAFAPC